MRPDRTRRRLSLLMIVMMAAACGGGGDSAARKRYNEALEKLEAGDWSAAAEGFLEARQSAGLDPELRHRAAYNLGLSHARQAQAQEDPQQAITQLRQSAAWLRDAVSSNPKDQQARVALEKVLRRIQVLADQLNKGENKLEARLDRVIEDQRTLRDRVRQLMGQVAESGGGAEPTGLQSEFESLATMERTLWADVGTISDLAAEELGLLEGKKAQVQDPSAPALSQEDGVRMVQLQGLEQYLQQARGHMGDTRRLLHRLQGDAAHRKADVALAELKRAREQLMDPVTVLKAVAQDQTLLLTHTAGLAELRKGTVTVNPGDAAGQAAAPAEPLAPPPWLTTEHLGERQRDIEQRTGEILARFAAASASAAAAAATQSSGAAAGPGSGPAEQEAQDPQQARILAAAGEAVPLLEQATAAMRAAASAIAADRLAEAVEQQNRALVALVAAIERFSGIRDLIELAYRDHQGTVVLLTPPGEAELPPEAAQELANMTTQERAERIREAVRRNLDRVARLQGLFADEIAAIEQQAQAAAQAQDPSAPAPQPGPGGDGQAEQIEAAKQQYRQAEQLRHAAYQALERLQALTEAAGAGRGKPGEALAAAQEAMTQIEELRRLFYSIIEHLKELLQHQTATHDATASAGAGPVDKLATALGPLVDAQTGHGSLGEALANALAEQADAAAQSPPQGPDAQNPQAAQDMAQRLAQAAEETRQAAAQMTGAGTTLGQAAEQAAAMSPDLTPILESQQAAMQHLEAAIRLLEPPQNQDQQQQGQQNQEQDNQDQQQQQQQQEQELSQQQAQRRLQELRDREAERMREKKRQERIAPEPVEKDW